MGNSMSAVTSPLDAPTSAVRNSEPFDSDKCHTCESTPRSSSSLQVSFVSPSASSSSTTECYAYSASACPLNRSELGRVSWAYLHTLAAYYPAAPTAAQQRDMSEFLYRYTRLYPCGYCADRSVEEIERNPPRAATQSELAVWMCEFHNEVNERINKPMFKCDADVLRRRWRTGGAECE